MFSQYEFKGGKVNIFNTLIITKNPNKISLKSSLMFHAPCSEVCLCALNEGAHLSV